MPKEKQKRANRRDKLKAHDLYVHEGLSVPEISQNLGFSKTSVGKWAVEGNWEEERLEIERESNKRANEELTKQLTQQKVKIKLRNTEGLALSRDIGLNILSMIAKKVNDDKNVFIKEPSLLELYLTLAPKLDRTVRVLDYTLFNKSSGLPEDYKDEDKEYDVGKLYRTVIQEAESAEGQK